MKIKKKISIIYYVIFFLILVVTAILNKDIISFIAIPIILCAVSLNSAINYVRKESFGISDNKIFDLKLAIYTLGITGISLMYILFLYDKIKLPFLITLGLIFIIAFLYLLKRCR